MVASAAVQEAGEDLFRGVTLLTAATQGRHSLLDQLVLKRQVLRVHKPLREALDLLDAELLALHYDISQPYRTDLRRRR